MKKFTLIATALAALATALPALGQSLQVAVTAGNSTTPVSSGGTVSLTATDVGRPAVAAVTVRNTGASALSVTGVSVSGTPEITLVSGSTFPVTLNPNATTTFSIQYLSSSGSAASAQVSIATGSGSFPFSITGTSPRLTYSYSFGSGASIDLNAGGTINFPAANAGTATAVTMTVANRGSAATTLQSIAVAGLGFQLPGSSGPIQVAAAAQYTFALIFTPVPNGGTQLGSLTITQPGGTISFPLTGTGTAASISLTYSVSGGNSGSLTDGATIAFPAIDAKATSTATITIANQGGGSAVLSGITLSGAGFSLTGVPGLPATVDAGQNVQFGILFAPTQAGTFNATFQINLSGRVISGAVTGSTTTSTMSATYVFSDGVTTALSNGSAIPFPPIDINATITATIEVTNRGTGPGTISGVAVSGTGFRAGNVPALPYTLPAGQSVRFSMTFAPTKTGNYSGTFRIDLSERSISGTLTASTASSNISLAYIEPDTNNTLALADGATMPFPNTALGSSSSVTLVVNNSGAGTGTVDSVAIHTTSPPAFQLLNLPAFPASAPPSQQLRFAVRFSPQQQQAYSGTLLISVNGHVLTINLQAQATGAQYTYTYGAGPTAVAPGGLISLGDTSVGQTTRIAVSITNGGTADGQISAITVNGSGLSVSDLPAFPFTLHPNTSQSFTLAFAPSQPGPATGRLTIGGDTFTVTANGAGSRLTYSYINTTPVTVTEGGVVIFSPIEVGKTEKLQFSMQNTGTTAATISSINLAAASSSFALEQLPAMPFNLDPNATTTFTLSFTPGSTGTLTATLQVNSSSFTLSGSGSQPEALPSYQFQAPTGSPQPAQQPSIGLTLSAPYPADLTGTLKLTFVSSVFTDDPAIQFATGGRTVNFVIPANSTQALFNGNATMALQTGTTAGSIVITPSFTMRSGFDMTPTTPDTLTFAIPSTAPRLLSGSITSQTTSSFTVVLNGFSTTRALRQLDVQFTPKPGQNFSTSKLTIDVAAAASAWYQGSSSQGTGGSFLAAIPFVLNGSSTADLVHQLQSLSITATNDAGVSTAMTVPIP